MRIFEYGVRLAVSAQVDCEGGSRRRVLDLDVPQTQNGQP
jgi:hypothetical protein